MKLRGAQSRRILNLMETMGALRRRRPAERVTPASRFLRCATQCTAARDQVALLPECLDDYIADDNSIRILTALQRGMVTSALVKAFAQMGVHRLPIPALKDVPPSQRRV